MENQHTNNPNITYDRKTAWEKVQHYCVYRERCHQEVRDKLYDWGLHSVDVESIIADLIENNFLNEERFAIHYTIGKFRQKKWGKIKIKNELKFKKISPYCIQKAINQIDAEEYLNTLIQLLKKKNEKLKEENQYIKYSKLMQHALYKGFEHDLIRDVIDEFFKDII